MIPPDIFGYLGGFLVTVSLIPQVIKTWKTKLTRDLSLSRYIMYVIGIIFWTIYGVLIENGPVTIMNGISLFIASSILYMKIKYK